MTCSHCCGADQLFDRKSAQKELKRYEKKGPRKSTKKLLSVLSGFDKKDKSLLDIGSGIGAIMWDFMKNHGANATDVEASSGYLSTAKEYAENKGFEGKVTFIQGDLTDISTNLPVFQFVTMDKVVCCYPDYKLILNSALSKCDEIFALTFPLGGPVAHVISFFGRVYLKIIGNSFRPFIHPSKEIENTIRSNGFENVYRGLSFPWRIWVFRKKKNSR